METIDKELVSPVQWEQKTKTEKFKGKNVKSERITINVTPEEGKALRQIAEQENTSLSTLLVKKALNQPMLKGGVAVSIATMDEIINNYVKPCQFRLQNDKDIHQEYKENYVEDYIHNVVCLKEKFDELKQQIFESYLTEPELVKLRKKEKKRKAKENSKITGEKA